MIRRRIARGAAPSAARSSGRRPPAVRRRGPSGPAPARPAGSRRPAASRAARPKASTTRGDRLFPEDGEHPVPNAVARERGVGVAGVLPKRSRPRREVPARCPCRCTSSNGRTTRPRPGADGSESPEAGAPPQAHQDGLRLVVGVVPCRDDVRREGRQRAFVERRARVVAGGLDGTAMGAGQRRPRRHARRGWARRSREPRRGRTLRPRPRRRHGARGAGEPPPPPWIPGWGRIRASRATTRPSRVRRTLR